MHVKESVKDFVHDVKRRFSQKHKRNSCSTCAADTYDDTSSDSSADSHFHLHTTRHSVSSSSISSLPGTPERSRFIPFVRPRTPPTSSTKHRHSVLQKVRRLDGKRSRLFSLGSHSSYTQTAGETHLSIQESLGSVRGAADERGTMRPSQGDYTDVIDISARSVKMGSVEESTQLHHTSSFDTPDTSGTLVTVAAGPDNTKSVSESYSRFDTVDSYSHQVHDIVVSSSPHDTSSGSQFDIETHSDSSGTLVTVASGPDRIKSVSESDSRFDTVDSYSDRNIVSVSDIVPLVFSPPSIYPMAEASEVPPVPPPKSEQPEPDSVADLAPLREEMITASSSSPPPVAILDKSTAVTSLSPPVVPQASRITTPAQPIRSTSGSPAPVYIPRLTAPSMFLPISNTDPLSALLTKYVPAEQRPRRDVVGEYAGRDVHEMVMSNSWRALAKMARDRIVASDPEDLGRILDLWSLRLSSLARLRLTNQASAECTNLFAVLNAVPPTSVPGSFPGSGSLPPSTPLPSSPAPAASLPLSPSGLSGLAQLPGTPSQKPSTLPPSLAGGPIPTTEPRQGTGEFVHPFELMVFHARVHYWSGDPLGYVDALSQILGRCKARAREEGRVVVQRKELMKAVRAREGGDVEGRSQSEQANEDEDAAREGSEDTEVQDKGERPDEGTSQSEQANQDGDKTENEDEDAAETTEEGSEDTEDEEEEEESDDVLTTAKANLSMWLERIARVCLILASQMIEMNDYQAAINLLVPLCTHRVTPTFLPTPSPALHSALARVYLLSGNLQKAEEHFSIAASAAENSAEGTDIVVTNTALLAAASGDWTRAEVALEEMVTKDPANFTAINNLAVTLLCQGRIKEGIDLLEAALKTSPSSVVVAEPFLFNLSTLYELRSAAAIDKKRELLLEVAKWSGDGLKTSCLKMPSS